MFKRYFCFLTVLLMACTKAPELSSGNVITPPTIAATTTNLVQLQVSIQPEGAGYLGHFEEYYPQGSNVKLNAHPNFGYIFTSWSGDAAWESPSIEIQLDAPTQLTANFARIPTLYRFSLNNYNVSGSGNILMDFDSDGDLDLLLSQFNWPPPQRMKPILAFRNNGNGVFEEATTEVFNALPVEAFCIRHHVIADFNGDGRQDIYLIDSGQDHAPYPGGPPNGGQNILLIQNDVGQLIDESEARMPHIKAWTHNVTAADIDLDGDIDIYTSNIDGSPYGPQLYINDGNGYFSTENARLPYFVLSRSKKFTSSKFVDIDMDGDPDLVLGGHGGDFLPNEVFLYDRILLNDGKGVFAEAPELTLPARMGGPNFGTLDIATADFNRDGWPDLLMATQLNYTKGYLQLLINNQDGTFSDRSELIPQDWQNLESNNCYGKEFTEPSLFFWAFVVDFNKDAWPDIIVQEDTTAFHLVFENQNGAGFEISENFSRYKLDNTVCPWAIVPGDLNNDEVMDIVMIYDYRVQALLREPKESPTANLGPAVNNQVLPEQPPTCILNPKPTGGSYQEVFHDDFNSSLLAGWEWVREEPDRWNLSHQEGRLQLVLEPEGYTRNILLRDAPEGDYELTTQIEFSPSSNFQNAGLVVYQDDLNFIRLSRGYCYFDSLPTSCIGNGIYFDKAANGQAACPNIMLKPEDDHNAFLKIRKEGTLYTAFYSENGSDWLFVGQHQAELNHPKVGLMASGSIMIHVTAEFEFFRISAKK